MVKNQGFQSFNLRKPLLKGIYKKGYKTPTPIQRKAIPEILEGKDVIAMSRTGSGKTAAFVLPCFEKLFQLEGKSGIKSLILVPTRELAHQTFKVLKEIGKFTTFKYNVISGGDSMEKQFSKLLEFPDIIVATPGRLLHVLVEMDMKLSSVEYVVFDEADRLFEMGFHEQLNEILHRLPQYRQTLLFSATLPQQLIDFAKAGLNDPQLIRLDVESKLSENLKTIYIGCRFSDKLAALLHLLKNVIDKKESTAIFVPTRHHVEYIRLMLELNFISSSFVFSSLEQKLRNENVNLLRTGKVNILIVTDIAARGIDIPILDNVINFNFPAKPKLFVHRVGRVARAGKSGTAYSIVSFDELPYVYDLCLFLNKPICFANNESTDNDKEGIYGNIPQEILDEENESIKKHNENNKNLKEFLKSCENGYKHYLITREKPSGDSVRKMKNYLNNEKICFHPIFKNYFKNVDQKLEEKKIDLLDSIKNYKTSSTIFEIDRKKQKANNIINQTRQHFKNVIEKRRKSKEFEDQENKFEKLDKDESNFKDDEYYIPSISKDYYSEKGLQLNNNILQNSVLSVVGDEEDEMMKGKLNKKKWDRKKKKFVGEMEDIKAKKFKTESGNWISTSYKTDLFRKWKEKNKFIDPNTTSFDENNNQQDKNDQLKERNKEVMKMVSNKFKSKLKNKNYELKDKGEIIKKRLIKQKNEQYQKFKKQSKPKKQNKRAKIFKKKMKFNGKRK